jgi:hypothetical protein
MDKRFSAAMLSAAVAAVVSTGSQLSYLISWDQHGWLFLFVLFATYIAQFTFYLFFALLGLSPVVGILLSREERRLLSYLVGSAIAAVCFSLLIGLLLKAFAKEPCTTFCLDPGTYFPFLPVLSLTALLQMFTLWLVRVSGAKDPALNEVK